SKRGGDPDVHMVRCLDGKGQEYQQRTRLDGSTYQVSGFAEVNARGAVARRCQPYIREGAGCDAAPPEGGAFEARRYDAAFRTIGRTRPDAGLYGSASMESVRFHPLSVERYDAEDSDAEGPYAGTPSITHLDGLGRVVATE